jgi:hypothetical protein
MDDVMIKLNSAHFGGRQRRQFKSNRGRVMPAVGRRPLMSTLQVFTPCNTWRQPRTAGTTDDCSVPHKRDTWKHICNIPDTSRHSQSKTIFAPSALTIPTFSRLAMANAAPGLGRPDDCHFLPLSSRLSPPPQLCLGSGYSASWS